MSTTAEDGAAEIARTLAAEVVQSIADSYPEDDAIDAQDLLAGTHVAHLFCLNGSTIERFVENAIADAIHDGLLALPDRHTPTRPAPQESDER